MTSRWDGLLDRRGAFAEHYAKDFQHPADSVWSDEYVVMSRALAVWSRTFTPYWVATDITRICEAAHPSLTLANPSAIPLPSPSGYLEFETPIRIEVIPEEARVISDSATQRAITRLDGLVWLRTESRSAIQVLGLLDRYMAAQAFGHSSDMVDAVGLPKKVIATSAVFREGDDDPFPELGRLAAALFILMGQTLTEQMEWTVSRAERRRTERLDHPVSTVRVIHLRRILREGLPKTEAGGVDWSHRWLVSGHWRHQWFPAASTHGWIYVNPYIKGPEDKPFVAKEVVVAVDR